MRKLIVSSNSILCGVLLAFSTGWFFHLPTGAFAQAIKFESPTSEIDTIDKLWAGFDSQQDPLEIEPVKNWQEDGIDFESLYFTSETFEGEKVRVYAVRGAAHGAQRVPGIIHMHGGGQTASLGWIRFWAKCGYACVTFDWCGNWKDNKREHFTKWGKVRGNMMEVNPGLDMTPTPRSNTWYHWIIAARRVLTLLERDPRVDPQRLGFFGISMGGFMTWNVAGLDPRVKAAVAFYGHGWDSYPVPPDLPGAPPDANKLLFRRLLASEMYAPRIRCPILFMSGTNDFCIGMDRSYDTLDLVTSAQKRQVFSVGTNHHLNVAEGRDLPLWMDWHLKGGAAFPPTPGIAIAGDSVPEIRVAPADPERVQAVKIYYALNNPKPQSRCWRPAVETRHADGFWYGKAPFLKSHDHIYAFSNVEYTSGPVLSTRLLAVNVTDLPGTTPTLKHTGLIDSMDDDSLWHYVWASTDPVQAEDYLIPWQGRNGARGFTLNPIHFGDPMEFRLGTHALSDPQWHGAGQALLAIDFLAARPIQNLKIKVVERHWQAHAKEFVTTHSTIRAAQGEWQTIQVTPSDFKMADGTQLGDWDEVDFLQFEGTTPRAAPPVFKRLRWMEPTS